MKTHTFRDWLSDHNYQLREWRILAIRQAYKDLGWKYFGWRPWRMFQADGWLPDLWYYLKCRLWHKYNHVRVLSLPPTWTDRCDLFVHALFQILCDVVNGEDWFENRVYYEPASADNPYEYDFRDEWQEMAVLYDWWVNVRPERDKATEESLHRWHEHFQSLGGFTSVPTENPHLRQLVFPEPDQTERAFQKDLRDREEFAERNDEEMMIRLVKMKDYLWT